MHGVLRTRFAASWYERNPTISHVPIPDPIHSHVNRPVSGCSRLEHCSRHVRGVAEVVAAEEAARPDFWLPSGQVPDHLRIGMVPVDENTVHGGVGNVARSIYRG